MHPLFSELWEIAGAPLKKGSSCRLPHFIPHISHLQLTRFQFERNTPKKVHFERKGIASLPCKWRIWNKTWQGHKWVEGFGVVMQGFVAHIPKARWDRLIAHPEFPSFVYGSYCTWSSVYCSKQHYFGSDLWCLIWDGVLCSFLIYKLAVSWIERSWGVKIESFICPLRSYYILS